MGMCRREEILALLEERTYKCPDTGCWIWQGQTSGNGRGGGYGRVALGGTTMAVHRVAYTHFYGIIPHKKQIDHLCKNRACWNPDHLDMVTHKQNQRRRRNGK